MKNKILKYSLFVSFLMVLSTLGFSVNTAKAEYYNSYPYYQSDYKYTTSYSGYPYYSSNNSNYYSYNQSCPSGFTLGIQNGSYICFQYLNENYYDPYNNYYMDNFIEGCLAGYIYSPITGQRCNQYNDYYNYDYYLYKNYGEISNFDVREGDDVKLEEGDNDREIMKIRFNVLDGDLRLDKVMFNFDFRGNSYNEDLPWNVFDEVRLLSDGKVIEKMDTDKKSDWDKEGSDSYSLTFDDLNEKLKKNRKIDLTLEVDVNSNLSGVNNATNYWDVFVPDRGIRVIGQNGDTIYIGDDGEIVSIEIDQ